MSTAFSALRHDAEALVVEHDPEMRERLVSALKSRGYGVQTCNTLAEGRRQFSRQSVVVTHANGDTAELRGFVDFVRQRAGTAQPYIVAVGEAQSPSGVSQGQLGLDAFVPVPMEEQLLAERLESIQLSPSTPNLPDQGAPSSSASCSASSASFASAASAPTAKPACLPASAVARPALAAAPSMLEHFAPVMLDHLSQALAMFDGEMRYLAANQRFARAFGLDQREILGRSHYELFPDLHANWRRLFERALAGESGRIEEDFFQRADGTDDWVRWEVRPWREADGAIGGVILSQEIITERKREDRRRIFDRNLAVSLFESASLPMLLVALDGRILRSSPAARAALGLQPTADGRMPFWQVYPDRTQEEAEKIRFASLLPPPTDGTLGDFAPADIIIPGTPVKRLHWSASAHRSATGETQALLLIGSLLPVARPVVPPPVPAAESPAAAAPCPPPMAETGPTTQPEELGHHLPFGLVQLDREGVVTALNPAVGALLGRPLAVGGRFEAWLTASAPEDVLRDPLLREWRDNVWRRQLVRTLSLASADGLLKEIEIRPRLLPDGHLLLVLTDVSEARRAEDALRTSEAKYRGLFRELPTGIALADRTGALVEGNPALEKLSGYSRIDLRRLRLTDLVAFESSSKSLASNDPRPATLVARDGTRHPVTISQGAIRNSDGDSILQACFFFPSLAPAATDAASEATPPPAARPAPDSCRSADAPSPLAPPADDSAVWRDLAFANLRTAMLVTDLRGRIRAANPMAARFFSTDPQSLEGAALFRLFQPGDPTGFSRDVSSHLNQNQRWENEVAYHDLAGQPIGKCRAEIVPAPGSVVPGLLCLLQPIFAAAAPRS